MTPRDIALQEIEQHGYHFARHGRNHDTYYNPELNCSITVKRHKFTENTLRYLRKEMKQNEGGKA